MEELRLKDTRATMSENKYLKTCYIYLAGWSRGGMSGLDEYKWKNGGARVC